MTEPLFRSVALDAKKPRWYGDVVLARPVSLRWLTLFAVVATTALLAFGYWGHYTKRSTVFGELVPLGGVMKVYPPEPSVIVERRVEEGQLVAKDQVLYVVTTERTSSAAGKTTASSIEQIELRKRSLRRELSALERLEAVERAGLIREIDALQQEVAQVSALIEVQTQQIDLAKSVAARYAALHADGLVSTDQYADKQANATDQQAGLSSLQRELISVQRQLQQKRMERDALALKLQTQTGELVRLIASADQELTQNEARRSLVITAPQAGRASNVFGQRGQAADPAKPLVLLVTEDAMLTANLFAPSRAIGFVQPDDQVLLRYAAFPYQKFGHQEGTVLEVTATALSSLELRAMAAPRVAVESEEPFYRITVGLKSQSIVANGKTRRLQAGMLLEADILGERRRLYEWALAPLYSLRGKLTAEDGSR
jgi:membrane fusion protein